MAASGKDKLETEIIEAEPKSIVLLKENAHYMTPAKYKQLVQNIKKDGCLTSNPLCCYVDGKLNCISGNHRIKASIDAGLEKIQIIVIKHEISRDRFLALQLSHNSIVGLDNEEILRRLYQQICDIDYKQYSGIDKAMVGLEEIPSVPGIDSSVEFEQMTLVFLPKEKDAVLKAVEEIQKRAILSKVVCVEELKNYDKVAETIKTICAKEKVHNTATAFCLMAEYAEKYLKNLEVENAQNI